MRLAKHRKERKKARTFKLLNRWKDVLLQFLKKAEWQENGLKCQRRVISVSTNKNAPKNGMHEIELVKLSKEMNLEFGRNNNNL